jgi:hypothetical protein
MLSSVNTFPKSGKIMARWNLRIVSVIALISGGLSSNAQVVINEIMYHPASENVLEEYIELHNRATTNVNVSGWRFSNGVDFTFPPNTIMPPNGYLVVAAHRPTFITKYAGVANVIGNWVGVLSNSRNDIDLDNASGSRIDSVEYADEGDWAVRQRGPLDPGTGGQPHRGWEWYKETDGLGKSLELVNGALPNEHGQNWRPSITVEGTPGAANSVVNGNIAPMILQVRNFPVVPGPTDAVVVTARLLNETASGVTATLSWRVDSVTPPPFTTAPMFDDGAHGDGVANDGLFGATIPAQPNDAVVEFYVSASDAQSNTRTWPAPALDEFGTPGQFANALYQVDDDPLNAFGGVPSHQPVYKIIMTEVENAELASIPGQSSQQGPNSQMNATFISIDASGVSLHYLAGVRNRGHASRRANPPNYRVNFRSDDMWQDVTGINLNSQNVHIQHFGSLLAIRSGSAGSYSRGVQVRVNNANRAVSGSPMFGSYAANEVYDSQWAERHFPNDSGGNIYKAVRDMKPPDFDYRTTAAYPSGNYSGWNFVNLGPEDSRTYTNTWSKETNVSEDDWTDLIGMLRVMGINGTTEFTEPAVRTVINVDAWLTHLAVMCLLGNAESGLNDGHNDDYYKYAGAIDRRFILMHHDLDQILGYQSRPTNDQLFGTTTHPPRGTPDTSGVGLMMQRFLSTNYVFRTEYLQTLQRLLDTTFSKPQFDALMDQTLGSYVPINTVNTMKNWMDQRRTYVQGLLQGYAAPGVATITGEPRSPTPSRNALMTVGGNDIVSYRFRLNNGSWGGERSITQALAVSNLPQGSSNTVYVIGKTSAGGWQSMANPTVSRSWIVNTNWPAVRINEVLARNDSAINHAGTFPDYVELHNEGTATIDVSGMRLTDDPSNPDKFTFPASTTLAPGAYLPLYANNNDGSGGIHLGFGLNDTGDDLYLFHRVADGGALLDSVQFGVQLPNLSIGRTNAGSTGSWILCQPTASAANNPVAVGNVYALRINEILTSPQSPFAEDFIEILNPNSAPVDMGGLSLTDAPIGVPNQHRIPELSFIAANGYFVFTADGSADEFDDVNFQLSSDIGEVALIGPGNRAIDSIIYGPQRPGISYGRCPDGASVFNFLVLPTPGSPNACPAQPPEPPLVVAPGHVWRFEESGIDLGTNWYATAYNDSSWLSGPGFHGLENNNFPPYPLNTPLTIRNPQQRTYYFRTTFTVANLANLTALQLEYAIDDGAVFYLNGQELTRFNMPAGPISYTNLALLNQEATSYGGPVTIPLSSIGAGENYLAVEVHNGSLQMGPVSADVVFGLRIFGIPDVDPGAAGLRINEVLANNGSIAEADGSTPDWVEFYNPSDSAVDLAGMSVSDSTLNPDRFVFPAGSIVPARGYRAIRFDADRTPSATNTGFGLNASGDSLYLFAPNNTVFDFVTFGFQAADFSVIRTGSTSWGLGVPTLGATNIPAILGDVTQLRINEWMANPVPGEDDWFEVYNPNNQPVSVGGCYLTDDLGNRTRYLPIPALSFIGAITNAWQEFVADGNTQNGAHHVAFNLRGAGEAIGLSTTNGQPIDSITFTNQTSGVSQGRLLDGSANIVYFPGTPSPGDPNYVLMNGVVISEVLTHTDLPLEDAVEIHNVGSSAVNVSGWWLSDSRGTPRKYQIPTTAPIPAGGYRVFYEYQFNDRDVGPIPFSFSSANGDEVFLSAATNSILTGSRAQAAFDASANGVSFGRYVNSIGSVDYPAMTGLSLGTSVTRESPPSQITTFRTGQGAPNPYPLVGPLVISEIMYHPPAIDTNDNVVHEFVEIHNPTASTVPLYDPLAPTNSWRLRDGVDFDFPPAMSIAPGGYLLVVSFNPANNPSALSTFQSRYGSNSVLVGPYNGKLDNGGEGVKLQKPDSPQTNGSVPFVLVDYVAYSDRAPWPTNADSFGASLQRVHAMGYANDPTNWLAAVPSPGPSGVVDSDSDGMPNSWEQLYSFNPNNSSDASQDADGDGLTNLQEYLAGTHPRSASSALRIMSVLHSGNTATMQFTATSNRTYSVQFRDSLSTTWSPLTTVSASATNGTRSVTDNNAGTSAGRFYRVATP